MAEIKEVTLDEVQEALRDVYDPEIPVNVLDLGLIYDIKINDGQVYVQMTLTAPGCGMGPYIAQNAEWRIAEIEGVEDVEVDMVFDPPWNPELITEDGKKINKGKIIAIINGRAREILKSERVALNFLSLISGVATTTRKFVDRVKGKNCKICCTRKTVPNLRSIQKYAVRLGGGFNHRFNLSDEILIKDNHIAIDGNIRKLVKRAIKNRKGKKITVEVDNLNQLKKIMGLKFNRILFDNMSPKNLRKAVKLSSKLYETEASGGITLKNVRKIASTGVKRISVGKITHSAPAVDFKLEF